MQIFDGISIGLSLIITLILGHIVSVRIHVNTIIYFILLIAGFIGVRYALAPFSSMLSTMYSFAAPIAAPSRESDLDFSVCPAILENTQDIFDDKVDDALIGYNMFPEVPGRRKEDDPERKCNPDRALLKRLTYS